ncbi:Retrovirus-related Pol polyprotein from transposon RE1 [Vitis vinifera]|uniref:Retrovirus-related Pol polyprotein from transposon RE1 n=1 Tax=Vitis vinifera TaxID=29760 RepID=A0A438K748_VITVI|nr:Retrovirus-related Pol polyprotein from transposon RE1 [Vitis vinifera]
MPHIDPSPMSPLHHSLPITPSGSNPCAICTDPVDKSLQVTDSLVGPSSSSLEPRPPLVAYDVAPTPAHLLVPRPADTNIVGSKWVFRTKYLPDGSIERLKARLVTKGYTQVPSLDYTDTSSPVIKATTIHVVLSLVVTNKWPIRQLDVKNAFLNGTLTENVYMEQPLGYIDPRYPNHVYQLKKALYGLKQAPRAWFQRFGSFLLTLGFSCNHADTSPFVFHQQSGIIYLLLYVNDIIITGNNSSLLDSFACKLNSEFATNDILSLLFALLLLLVP